MSTIYNSHYLSFLYISILFILLTLVTFQIYDTGNNGKISMNDIKTMLTAVLKENSVVMTESQIDMMVANTFKEHDVSIFESSIPYLLLLFFIQ